MHEKCVRNSGLLAPPFPRNCHACILSRLTSGNLTPKPPTLSGAQPSPRGTPAGCGLLGGGCVNLQQPPLEEGVQGARVLNVSCFASWVRRCTTTSCSCRQKEPSPGDLRSADVLRAARPGSQERAGEVAVVGAVAGGEAAWSAPGSEDAVVVAAEVGVVDSGAEEATGEAANFAGDKDNRYCYRYQFSVQAVVSEWASHSSHDSQPPITRRCWTFLTGAGYAEERSFLEGVPSPVKEFFKRPQPDPRQQGWAQDYLRTLGSRLGSRVRKRRRSDGTDVATHDVLSARDRVRKKFEHARREVEKPNRRCCKQQCLQSVVPPLVLVGTALTHHALPFQERKTELLRALRDYRTSSEDARKEWDLRVQPGGYHVCGAAFAAAYGLAADTLTTYKKEVRGGGAVARRASHGNQDCHRLSSGGEDCAGWLSSLFGLSAQAMPHKVSRSASTGETRTTEFLPSGVFPTLHSVYQYYASGVEARQRTPVAFSTFRRIWQEQYWEVRLYDLLNIFAQIM